MSALRLVGEGSLGAGVVWEESANEGAAPAPALLHMFAVGYPQTCRWAL